LSCQLLYSGLYTIIVQDLNLQYEGNYNITFLKIPGAVSLPQDLDGGRIDPGQCHSGSIVASDMDAFQFYGVANDTVIITAVKTSGNLNTEIYLYDPNGALEDDTDPLGGDELSRQLNYSGLYTIVVQDYLLQYEGTYNICLTKIPSTLRPGLYNPCPSNGGLVSDCRSEQLQWEDVNDATGYDVYFGVDVNQPLVKIANNVSTSYVTWPTTVDDQIYYWRVIAHTAGGDIFGPTWWFETSLTDFDCDGVSNFLDFDILGRYWLQDEPSVDIAPPGGDGTVDTLDLAVLAEEWLGIEACY